MTAAGGKGLAWSEAVRDPDSPARTRFLESHVDLVKYVALRISGRLPASVELDDLIHDGIVGLLDAVERFDPGRNVRFRTYAESRIHGAILDGLRRKDWRPRSVRHRQRSLDAALGQLGSQHQRSATEEEIAAALGLDLEAYRALLVDLNTGTLLSLEELPAGADPADAGERARPDAPLDRREMVEALVEELGRLPERERRVLELYYVEGLNMKEVGAVLGVTESRVCQLHAQCAARLRSGVSARLHAAVPAGRGGVR